MKTLKEIAAFAGVPESTARIYRDEFEEFLSASGEGRRRRYGDESAERLKRICQWKRAGWTASQIRDELSREVKPQERLRLRTTEERLDELTALARTQASELALLRAEVGALRRDLRELIARIQQDGPLSMEDVLRLSADAKR